ncbi:MAG: isoprenylcysteine carboxylmethyltransferase family protein [Anaerolineae bacterium]|nr:isoprenylcysteine carboxylmethyltransferase family protein [Anaerolineae bacterium]
MDAVLIFYIALVLLYRFSETLVMAKTGTLTRKPKLDWTAYLIMVPYWSVIVVPALVYGTRGGPQPALFFLIAGAVFFAAATVIRVKAHLDLGTQFSMFLEQGRSAGLVTTGLYAKIRHPLYLANVCLFVACPTFLGVVWAWGLTALGIAGVVWRIQAEERFLRESFEGYAAYSESTWRLVPYLY